MQSFIKKEIQKTQSVLALIAEDADLLKKIEAASQQCITALRAGHKILFAGNGGSAADSQHLAAELVGRLNYDRPGIAAIALTTDTSALTAIGNDYSFEDLFARQLNAIGQAGDIFVGISTSGKSANILKAFDVARSKGIISIGFTGKIAPMMAEHCDHVINVPSTETSKIQECHIMLGHVICGLIQDAIYGAEFNPVNTSVVAV